MIVECLTTIFSKRANRKAAFAEIRENCLTLYK
jgi:hypothetical protein